MTETGTARVPHRSRLLRQGLCPQSASGDASAGPRGPTVVPASDRSTLETLSLAGIGAVALVLLIAVGFMIVGAIVYFSLLSRKRL